MTPAFIDRADAFRKTIHVEKIREGVYHAQFTSQRDLTTTFLRLQEHYESPQFKNKIFTLQEFRTWYAAAREGKFTYYTDWNGFNVPGHILKPFYEGAFNPLTYKEVALLDAVRAAVGKVEDYKSYYLLGTHDGDPDALLHEAAHALYYLDREYRRLATKIVVPLAGRGELEDWLEKQGYNRDVWVDEIQAHLSADAAWLSERIDISPYITAASALRLAFQDFWVRGL